MKSDLQKFLEFAEFDCQSYSGRGMYGKSCLAVNALGLEEFIKRTLSAAFDIEGDFEHFQSSNVMDQIEGFRTDSLGKQMIIYFPEVQFSLTY